MLEMSANVVNKYKLIHAYFKKEGIDFINADDYFYMPFSALKELICSKYEIKGKLDWKSMENAKLINHAETEHELQVRVCKYLKENKICHFAVPNGFVHNGKSPLETAKYINYLKQEGYKPGIFDLVILSGKGQIAFLELKTIKGVPSENQLKWRDWLTNNGYLNKICYGYDEAIEFINTLV